MLAATILFIATNAGVIGASRITYAMAGYRQLPATFRRLHPRFARPGWRSSSSRARSPSWTILPGQTDFLGTMYSFGATLSFTVAHASIVALRYRYRTRRSPTGRGRTPDRGVDWPLFAILGGIGTLIAWLVIVVQEPTTRWAGIGWLVLGFLGYASTAGASSTRRWPHGACAPDRARAGTRDRVPHDRRAGLAHRRVGGGAGRGGTAGGRAGSEDRSRPGARDPPRAPARRRPARRGGRGGRPARRGAGARRELRRARVPRLLRARVPARRSSRRPGQGAELVVVGAPRRTSRRGRPVVSETVDAVLKASPARVLVVTGRKAA